MSKLKIIVLLAVLTASLHALAAPAPYFKWISLEDGTVVCAQFSPGEGWELGAGKFGGSPGPFKDFRCKTPGKIEN
ncbi:MAG TPA: hypothetical protein VIE17_04310 [Methylophilaceae bacterium]|jgi:hypothetical protein